MEALLLRDFIKAKTEELRKSANVTIAGEKID
jgi:hypothetical protein